MLKINNYKQVPYSTFIDCLKSAFNDSGKTYKELMTPLGFITKESIRNLFNPEEQKVKDAALTKAAEVVEMDCLVIWQSGKKYFYIAKSLANAAV